MSRSDIAIIGGGIVGLATARALREAAPHLSITILEKEADVAQHQSTHNSGVLHAGLAYAPGTYKARLARRGIRQMVEFCQARAIAHDVCGKLVVATDVSQLPRLHAMKAQGEANGLAGLRVISADEARDIEPHVGCAAALHVPEEGIVDFGGVCAALARELTEAGVRIATDHRVLRIHRKRDAWVIETQAGDVVAGFLINCAGLYSDRVLEMTGERAPARVVPFRGEYYRLHPSRESLVRNLIYPLPEPGFPFLGVHFTRRITGGIEAGPNAVLAMAREGYRRGDLNPTELFGSLGFAGLWRFALRHRRMVAREVGQSISKRRFLQALQSLVPAVTNDDLVEGGNRVRAQAMLPSGTLVHDFLWVEHPGALHALNVPSPAATASLAIGGEIASRALRSIDEMAPRTGR